MEVYFIRHTTPLIEKGICYGQTDLELANSYRDELGKVRTLLPDSFDAVYSSPLKRCQILASDLSSRSVLLDNQLKEIHFGDWEMQPWDDISKTGLDPWMKDFVNVAPPNGESMLDLQSRILNWWKALQKSSYSRVAVVTHSGVIRTLHAYFNHIPLEKSFQKFRIDYGGVFIHDTSQE